MLEASTIRRELTIHDKELLAKVLARGIADAQGDGTWKDTAEAINWIKADDWREPLGFLSVCNQLGLDSGIMKKVAFKGPRFQYRRFDH